MNLINRFLSVACFGIALASYIPAQTSSPAAKLPSHKTIANWLQSDDPRTVAWGAHDAITAHDQQLTSELLTRASQWQPLTPQNEDEKIPLLSQEQKDKRDAMAAVVDALVQMNVSVPTDTLRVLAPDFGNAVAILLARMPADDAEPLAFNFYRTASYHGYGLQYVSAALLALRPPTGFASDLVKSITVRAAVSVIHPGAEGFGGGSVGDCFRDEPALRKGWPSTGQYRLSKENSAGATLVVKGIDPIYATREQSTTYLDEFCASPYLGPYERQRLIAEMLDIAPESMPWKTEVQTTIEFISSEQFDFEFHRFIDDQEEKYRTTAAALAARSLIGVADIEQTIPKLRLVINEVRGTADDPTVQLTNLPANVESSNSP